MAAARAWAAGTLVADRPTEEPEAIADARRWGASPEEIEGVRQHLALAPAGRAAVWRANVAIVLAFIAVATQWRTAIEVVDRQMRTRFIGLDYAAVLAGLDADGTAITPDIWRGIRSMELHARDALNGVTVH